MNASARVDAVNPSLADRPIPLPRHFYIDIGDVCNLRCPFCATCARTSGQRGQFMSFKNYQTILKKIQQHSELIALCNWGEPFLHPDLLNIILSTASKGIKTHIDSNLSTNKFDEESAANLVRSGLSSIFVSLDGTSQKTYEKYRVRGRFDVVVRNILLIRIAKQLLSSNTPFIGWQFHVHRYNQDDMDAARELARHLGIPIHFKQLSTPLPDWKSRFHGSDEMFIQTDASMSAAYDPPYAPEFKNMTLHPAVPHPCRQMFHGTMTIAPTGDVYPCTTVEGKPFVVGNLLENDLDEIWYGSKFRAMRSFISGFGPVQNSGTPCETLSCALAKKHDASV